MHTKYKCVEVFVKFHNDRRNVTHILKRTDSYQCDTLSEPDKLYVEPTVIHCSSKRTILISQISLPYERKFMFVAVTVKIASSSQGFLANLIRNNITNRLLMWLKCKKNVCLASLTYHFAGYWNFVHNLSVLLYQHRNEYTTKKIAFYINIFCRKCGLSSAKCTRN